MKLAVSNIAWPRQFDCEAAGVLRRAGISGVEVAPTRVWQDWRDASCTAARGLRLSWAEQGFSVPSLQALLYGKPECRLFGTASERRLLSDHLLFCAELAEALGAHALVFGAPKNRELDGLSPDSAWESACEFFQRLAPGIEDRGVALCIEANPPEYGCDFITDSAQAVRLVDAVNRRGVRLHLDTACMHLAREDMRSAVQARSLCHFHVSEPFLGTFASPQVDHPSVAEALTNRGYCDWISLEMRESQNWMVDLSKAAHYLARTYRTS